LQSSKLADDYGFQMIRTENLLSPDSVAFDMVLNLLGRIEFRGIRRQNEHFQLALERVYAFQHKHGTENWMTIPNQKTGF